MLILLRHGQTTSNVDRKLDTQLPGAELTELGREQALAAGDEIRGLYDVDRVVSSEALRARQTAALAFGPETASGFADIPAVPGLHEVNAGRWEMQNSREAHEGYFRAFRGFYQRDLAAAIEEGESLELFLARYHGALAPYALKDGNTVIVSHGGAIRAFAANATEVSAQYAEQSHLANCQFVVIDPVGEFGEWRVVQWADYPHPSS
ncbi:histidine phosphatase family protein [Corynebacterium sp. TA-R-1]|uniref:Histidine phosphatase family protein n=1 Tax=Corynebacterium stercoris TaxID=2943490 RepID=A0ABT1G0H3_9CORY|nr:histidine phosphatase family protein [Corynebacterium stercoris]MCP1387516.1 histidine phosphatase family protein [Corynebacterium stercoris]